MTNVLDKLAYAPGVPIDTHEPGWRARARGESMKCKGCHSTLVNGLRKRGYCMVCKKSTKAEREKILRKVPLGIPK